MKKLFISQPTHGKTNEEIKLEREKAVVSVKDFLGEDVELIDSFFENASYDAKPILFLGKALELLSTADITYFMRGWENDSRCRIEHRAAERYYRIKTITE